MKRNKWYYISMVTTIIAIMCLFGCFGCFLMFGALQRNKDIVKAYKEHYCPYCGQYIRESEE